MHFTGQVYRHPIEARTPLLEVTAGCSHNKCTFCTMYRNTPFKLSPLSHVEEDLIEMKSMGVEIKRIFLVNGEPFILSTDKLVEISNLIHKYFPEIETITCYASVKSLKTKSLEDLKKLRKLKYNQLHIGLETAYDPALKQMNKGFTQAEAYENIKKLMDAGFEWDAIVMMGVAGKGMSDINVKETAKLLNELPPYLVSIMSTSVSVGSELEVLRDKGEFIEPTEREMLEEEKKLLELLDFEDAYFFGGHVFNLAPINGSLKIKEKIIKEIDNYILKLDDHILNGTYQRPNI
ncbi:radical SAM protein [Acidaminobacter sp. JC074]|uniref:radical SAM protein n=1 Tax=Acidaminobacter sp. JC074 TaxID=2530199 RepID=UPI001F0F80ED|nr:radical SAM protein [Acidaminobacter sp. JC074]MCH4886423.1 radical SAM protein [Acidaminobacter sp. JC074]